MYDMRPIFDAVDHEFQRLIRLAAPTVGEGADGDKLVRAIAEGDEPEGEMVEEIVRVPRFVRTERNGHVPSVLREICNGFTPHVKGGL